MKNREHSTMHARARWASLLLAASIAAVAAVALAPARGIAAGAPELGARNLIAEAASAAAPSPRAAAAVRYVAKKGSDQTGDGSRERPWLTIQKAAGSVRPGQLVNVGPGVYDERVTIPAAASGSARSATRFVAHGAVTVTGGFDIRADRTRLSGFEVVGGSPSVEDVSYRGQVFVQGSHVTLTGLNIHDISRASAICLLSTESHITIDRCTIVKPKHACISTTNARAGAHASHVTVRNCVMKRWGGEVAIYAYGDRWLITGCEIQGIDAGWQGAPVWNGDGIWPNYSSHSVIRNCRIYDIWPYKGYASGQHADGIQFWVATKDLKIIGCTLGSWKRGGPDNDPGATNAIMAGTVDAGSTCTATIKDCLFLSGIARNSHAMCAADGGGTLALRLTHNTFFSNYPDLSGCDSIVLRRNIFYTCNGGSDGGIDSDYNAFLWNPNDRGASRIYADDAAPRSHSVGKTYGTRLVAREVFVDPDVSAATEYGLNADFRLKPGSRLARVIPARRPGAGTRGSIFTE